MMRHRYEFVILKQWFSICLEYEGLGFILAMFSRIFAYMNDQFISITGRPLSHTQLVTELIGWAH